MNLAKCLKQWNGARKIERAEVRAKTTSKVVIGKVITGIGQISNSFRPMIEKVAQEVVNRETIAVKRAAKRYLEPSRGEERGVSGFQTWIDSFYKEHESYVQSKLRPVLRTYQEMVSKQAGSILGAEVGAGDLERFFDDTVKNYVHWHVRSSSGQLSKIVREIDPDDLLNAINQRMDEWFEKRAGKIAMDESVRLANASSRETWRMQGVQKLRWQIQGKKTCPFCKALDGRVVGIEDPFFDEGDVLYVDSESGKFDIYNPESGDYKEKQFPKAQGEKAGVQALKVYGKKFHPPIHQGCDCMIVPEAGVREMKVIEREFSPMTSIGKLANCIFSSVRDRGLFDVEFRRQGDACNDYVRKDGKWFLFGKEVVKVEILNRLKRLGLPPAWESVTASINSRAKVQAIGMDKAGRWQYRYSAEHIEREARKKFDRVKIFSKTMPEIREGIQKGIEKGDPRAYLLRLEDKTAIRAGSAKDFKAAKKAYGLTTLQYEHLKIEGNKIILNFTAKEGIPAYYELKDKVLADWLQMRKGMVAEGKKLFADVPASKLNDYLKELAAGQKFTIKDFRTYHGTRIAFEELKGYAGKTLTVKEKKAVVKDVCEKVGSFLKNTPAMAKKSYIDPMVWDFIGGI